eukprot:GHVH01006053.1.p1 GENE.GHVH01006053.1~~GHVH01006053.1.p1  ORF type:complete len:125 (-),score=9.80 GHVH01006053.1:89-463(-)
METFAIYHKLNKMLRSLTFSALDQHSLEVISVLNNVVDMLASQFILPVINELLIIERDDPDWFDAHTWEVVHWISREGLMAYLMLSSLADKIRLSEFDDRWGATENSTIIHLLMIDGEPQRIVP